MASQSLYRKWRSQTFSDLVGQAGIVTTLKNALDTGSLSHAYLFTGPRGTGKTSTARLLAKTLNCTHRKNGEPCNECEQCREITAGNSFNVIEIDAASNRGIDSIRELREKVMVRPASGKYKIYILDEAHMLTTEAFNALLKTLEEPPEHAIFVLATTDVHKMLPTVISRCQRFDFKRITTRQIVEHLCFVATQEQITLEQGAAELIARAAAGGMRDALSLLDQAMAYCGQHITLAQVQTMLGVADPRAIQKLVTFVAQLDSAGGLHLIHELAEAGADLRQINAQVAEYWRGMMLAKAGADIAVILDSTADETREMLETARFFALDELTDCARLFAQNELMQKNQGTPQLGLELALLAAIERHRNAPPSSLPRVSSPPVSRVESPAQPPARLAPSTPPSPVMPLAPVQSSPASPSPVNRDQQREMQVQPQRQETQVAHDADTMREEEVFDTVDTGDTAENDELPDWDTLSYNDGGEDEEVDVVSISPEIATPVHDLLSIPDVNIPEEVIETVLVSEPAALRSESQEPTEIERSGHEQESQEDGPLFTLADVKEKWEQIKRRVKTKKGGTVVASVLNDFAAISVQGTATLAIIVAQATHVWHYKKIQDEEYHKVIAWALKIELGQECQMRFLSPEQTVSSSLPSMPSFSLPQPGETQEAPATSMEDTIATGTRSSSIHEASSPSSPSNATSAHKPLCKRQWY
jgi:DNA polymerase-3 subunit gamma/tau